MDERCSGGIVTRALRGWGVVRDFVEEREGEDGEEGDDDCEPERVDDLADEERHEEHPHHQHHQHRLRIRVGERRVDLSASKRPSLTHWKAT